MTTSDGYSNNIAGDWATVAVQAQAVHGDVTVYQTSPDSSPEDIYRIGFNYLNGNMPAKARHLINEAMMRGYVTSEVWFHWLLAFLGGRTFRQLSKDDFRQLQAARTHFPPPGTDVWADGLAMIFRLLDAVKTPTTDLRIILKEFDKLEPIQRDTILRHLDLSLQGPLKDHMWKRTLRQTEANRINNDRFDRIWMFFQPRPAMPRVRPVFPLRITLADWVKASAGTAAFVIVMGYINVLLGQQGNITTIPAFIVSVLGGYVCANNIPEWMFRTKRLQAKNLEYLTPRHQDPWAGQGFTKQVDRRFAHYFRKYAPDNIDHDLWLKDTSGIRKIVRDEIVEIYRESRTSCAEIAWLIRHEVQEIRERWSQGTLLEYRDQLRTPWEVQSRSILGIVALTLGIFWTMVSTIQADIEKGPVAVVMALISGCIAAHGWLHIDLERRRLAADQAERDHIFTRRKAAYDRWYTRLENKPSDPQMAAWLDCDRKILIRSALQYYKLTSSRVIAHAFIEAPGANCKRARVRNGPWRYSHYRILLFLLTTDGVRQVKVDLDFKKGIFYHQKRISYHFDNVASVEVNDKRQTFELTLTNGQTVRIPVVESGADHLQPGEDLDTLSEVDIEAMGMERTLHILEGIAAEGKEWITRLLRYHHDDCIDDA